MLKKSFPFVSIGLLLSLTDSPACLASSFETALYSAVLSWYTEQEGSGGTSEDTTFDSTQITRKFSESQPDPGQTRLLQQVGSDAAAFIGNGGTEPSPLLQQAFQILRRHVAGLSDLDLAYLLIDLR